MRGGAKWGARMGRALSQSPDRLLFTRKDAQRNQRIILKPTIQPDWGTSKSGVMLRILCMAPKVDEKGVALKVGEKRRLVSHLSSCPCRKQQLRVIS